MNRTIHRAEILHFVDNPKTAASVEKSYQHFEDGGLVVLDGTIIDCLPFEIALERHPEAMVQEHPNAILMPGFIDTHIHYPQTQMVAAYGEQLLEWLNTYTFPTEKQFADCDHASKISNLFLDELLRAGTTTALVFGTVHPESIDAFFQAAQERNLRMIAGKVMMNRNAPEYLLDTSETGYQQSKELIERWHGVDRL
jgi:guanine deaminase